MRIVVQQPLAESQRSAHVLPRFGELLAEAAAVRGAGQPDAGRIGRIGIAVDPRRIESERVQRPLPRRSASDAQHDAHRTPPLHHDQTEESPAHFRILLRGGGPDQPYYFIRLFLFSFYYSYYFIFLKINNKEY